MKLIRAADVDWEEQWDDDLVALGSNVGQNISMSNSRSQLERQRRLLVAFTAVLVICMPIFQHFYPSINAYVLSAAMAFTIGTNLTIFIISTQIEDKADQMERKMESLLDELDRAATGLDNFQTELSGVNIPAIVETVEKARLEMEPSLERLQGVSWENISSFMDTALQFWDTVDKERLDKFIKPFLVDGETYQFVQAPLRTFDDEFLPTLDDDFMPDL